MKLWEMALENYTALNHCAIQLSTTLDPRTDWCGYPIIGESRLKSLHGKPEFILYFVLFPCLLGVVDLQLVAQENTLAIAEIKSSGNGTAQLIAALRRCEVQQRKCPVGELNLRQLASLIPRC